MRKLIKLSRNFLSSEVDGELILVHGETGGFFALKDVGFNIWRKLDDEADLDVISGQICDEYDVEDGVCSQSVAEFADQLVATGFAEYR